MPWAGADNTNHYFALSSDLFDPTKVEQNVTPPGFIERLNQAGNGTSTYDRYTFYRLLAQLGTDSSPESGKMNLNYDNLNPYRNGVLDVNNGVASVTNFAAWTPIAFFTNAVDRMLRVYTTNWFQADPSNYLATYYGLHTNYYYTDGSGNVHTNDPSGLGLVNLPFFGMTNQIPAFGVTNIPVYVNGQYVYSSAMQRVLQLAANIYDATTNRTALFGQDFPSVFRPLISRYGTNLFVTGYTNVSSVIGANDGQLSIPFDAATLANSASTIINVPDNVYGVPWIVGAKKGFPNFNEFSIENSIQLTRKLQFNRDTNTIPPSNYTTNQMYLMSVTNYYGVECWNSYTNNYPRTGTGPIGISGLNVESMTLTNDGGYTYVKQATNTFNFMLSSWTKNLFVVPLNTNDFLFTNATFVYNNPGLHYFGTTANFPDSEILPLPQFGFVVSNQLQLAIIDYSDGPSNGHIVDYVQLALSGSPRDINGEIADQTTTGLWSTNLVGGPPNTLPQGVVNQYNTSRNGNVPLEDRGEGKWVNAQVPGLPPGISTLPQAEQIYFTAFFSSKNTANYISPVGNFTVTNLSGSMQAPYTPTRTRVQRLTWQANDPLVHYLASDLKDLADDTNATVVDWPQWPGILGQPNNRYNPWGGNPKTPPNPSTPDDPKTASAKNMALKDPLVTSSDLWDFPTNTLPTAGWLGRVHRGTPWQTVYLKATIF